MGTVNNAAGCTKEYITSGFEPAVAPGARHPLFLYFTGTNFVNDEATFRQLAAPAVRAVTEAMARRGFVALWVEYDNSGAGVGERSRQQLECLFGAGSTSSVLDAACACRKSTARSASRPGVTARAGWSPTWRQTTNPTCAPRG